MKKITLLVVILSFCFNCYAQSYYEVCSWQVETRIGGLLFGISESKDGADAVMYDFQRRNKGLKYDISDHVVSYHFTIYPINKVDGNPVTKFQNYAKKAYKVLTPEETKSTEVDKKRGIDSSYDYYVSVRDDKRDFVKDLIAGNTLPPTKNKQLPIVEDTQPAVKNIKEQSLIVEDKKPTEEKKSKQSLATESKKSTKRKNNQSLVVEDKKSTKKKKNKQSIAVEDKKLAKKKKNKQSIAVEDKKSTKKKKNKQSIAVEDKKLAKKKKNKVQPISTKQEVKKQSITKNQPLQSRKPPIETKLAQKDKRLLTENINPDTQVILWEVPTRANGLLFGISVTKDEADAIMYDFQKRNEGSKYDISDHPAKYKPTNKLDKNSIEHFANLAGKPYKVISIDDIRSLDIIRTKGFDVAVDYYMDARGTDREFTTKRLSYIYNGYDKYRILSENFKSIATSK